MIENPASEDVTAQDPTSQDVTSMAVEIKRIMSSGTIWTGVAVLAPALGLGPLLASGWRPAELPLFAAAAFWIGALAAAFGLVLLIWAGCPVLAFSLEDAYKQKVFCIRVGIVTNVAGMALVGLSLLLSP